ncbi:MAG: hypothetical protein JST63_10380 [Bacteroidetes bacterium]|nr:hypothetical protein [Bacteroidota bacterium]
MNLAYKHLLPQHFVPESRVWIYQANRIFTLSEVLEVEKILENFIGEWHAHGAAVNGFGTVMFGRFIILMVDETTTNVSGCSIESSVNLIKEIEKQFNITLLDRQLLAFVVKNNIQLLPLSQIKYAAENGFITKNTLYFNNTVSTKQELEDSWIVPVSESWLSGKLHLNTVTPQH